jgi:hypothetical protein
MRYSSPARLRSYITRYLPQRTSLVLDHLIVNGHSPARKMSAVSARGNLQPIPVASDELLWVPLFPIAFSRGGALLGVFDQQWACGNGRP